MAETDAEPAERFSINKIQIRPGRPALTENDMTSNYLTKLPVLPKKAAAYVPITYTFRVKATSNRIKYNTVIGRSPPFHLLLDHTIAVIWTIFGNKEYNCPLGIAQLQWALLFLKTIHTSKGDRPADVQLCIDAIENILIDQYADLSKEMSELDRMNGTVHYIDGALGSSTMITQNLPFSLNYSEMTSKNPPDKDGDKPISINASQAEVMLEDLKTSAGVESIEKLDTVSKHKAINVLKMWKEEQVGKIREELKRLRSIEDKMANIDENFTGYVQDDLEILYSED